MNFVREVHPSGSAKLFKFVPDEFVRPSRASTVAEKITSASAHIEVKGSAQYTLTETVFFMDEKQEPTGRYLRRVSVKLYGVLTVFEEPY